MFTSQHTIKLLFSAFILSNASTCCMFKQSVQLLSASLVRNNMQQTSGLSFLHCQAQHEPISSLLLQKREMSFGSGFVVGWALGNNNGDEPSDKTALHLYSEFYDVLLDLHTTHHLEHSHSVHPKLLQELIRYGAPVLEHKRLALEHNRRKQARWFTRESSLPKLKEEEDQLTKWIENYESLKQK